MAHFVKSSFKVNHSPSKSQVTQYQTSRTRRSSQVSLLKDLSDTKNSYSQILSKIRYESSTHLSQNSSPKNLFTRLNSPDYRPSTVKSNSQYSNSNGKSLQTDPGIDNAIQININKQIQQQQMKSDLFEKKAAFKQQKSESESLKSSQVSRFLKSNCKFASYSPSKIQQAATGVKDQFNQSIKYSSNLILKSSIQEFQMFTKAFQNIETQYNREVMFQVTKSEAMEADPLLAQILPFEDLQNLEFDQMIDYLIKILQNKVENVQDVLYTAVKQMFVLMKINVRNNGSINFYFQLGFVYVLFCEAFGQVTQARLQIEQLVFMAEIHKMYELKIFLYYRLASCLNKQTQYDKGLVYGKKVLKLCWFFHNIDYEVKCYQILSQSYKGLLNLEEAAFLYERYINFQVQQNGHIKNMGIKYASASMKIKGLQMNNRSLSQDDFDIGLIMAEEQQQIKKDYIPKSTTMHQKMNDLRHLRSLVHMVGDRKLLAKPDLNLELSPKYINGEKIDFDKQIFSKKDCIMVNDQSYNRNLANYFSEKSAFSWKNNAMQQIYKPSQTVPILICLLQNLRSNYMKYLQTKKNLPQF